MQSTSLLLFPRTRQRISRIMRKPHRQLFVWWALAIVASIGHAVVRGWMDDLGSPVRGSGLETAIFRGLPSERLQESLLTSLTGVWSWTIAIVHASWFFAPWCAALLVTVSRRDRVPSLFLHWFVLWIVVLPLFALFPMQPPWMADGDVSRVIAERLGRNIDDSNALAAMPSMHVALPALIALWFFKERWIMPAAVFAGYTAIVGFEVVVAGEHYVIDVIAGVAVAGVVATAFPATQLLERMAKRRNPSGRHLGLVADAVAVERGQNLIEFALLSPFIIMFIAAIVVFGVALNTRSSLQQAVREGARQAAVGKTLAQVQTLAAGNAPETLATGDVRWCFPTGPSGTQGRVGDPVRVYLYQSGGEGHPHTLVDAGGIFNALGAGTLSVRMKPRATARLERSVSAATVSAAGACPS